MKLLVSVVCVMVAVQMGGVHAQSIESFDPPAFNDNRVTTDLLFMYTFDQQECRDGAFADKRNDTTSLLGDFTYDQGDWGTTEKCPSVNNTGTIFENAYHGTKSQGQRSGASPSTAPLLRPDWVESGNDITALKSAMGTDFTVELWIRPSFNSGDPDNDEQFVLLEIGDPTPTAGSGFTWTCGDFSHDMQLIYDNSGVKRFELTYRTGPNPSDCQTINFGGFSLTAGSLYHVVVSAGTIGATQVLGLYIDGVAVGSSTSGLTDLDARTGSDVSLGDWSNADVIRVGSSAFTLSSLNTAVTVGTFSWPGDILFFAMSDRAFHSSSFNGGSGQFEAVGSADITSNFAAGLPNSVPVPPNDEFIFVGNEDEFVAFDPFQTALYDFDEDAFGENASDTFTITSRYGPQLRIGSSFRETDDTTIGLNDAIPRANGLEISNSVEDGYGDENSGFYVVRSDAYSTSEPVQIHFQVNPTNDAPIAVSRIETNTAQAQSRQLSFIATDPDCDRPNTAGSSFDDTAIDDSCGNLGNIEEIRVVNATTPFGILYFFNNTLECPPLNATSNTVMDNDEFEAADLQFVDSNRGEVTLTLCFEACFDESTEGNTCPPFASESSAQLGQAIFEFSATDQNMEESEIGTVTTNVTNVLVIDDQQVLVDEEGIIAITISGTDNFCEQRPDAEGCPLSSNFSRTKIYTLVSVPDPETQGDVFADEDLTIQLFADDELVTNETTQTATVYFRGATDAFNLDTWPLCGASPGRKDADTDATAPKHYSACALGSLLFTAVSCQGPFCNAVGNNQPITYRNLENPTISAFTTQDLQGYVMGGCGGPSDPGCPFQITATMSVDSGNTPSDVGSAADIYVVNVNDDPSILLPNATLANVSENVQTPIKVFNNSIRIVDSDGDNRIIDVVVQVPEQRGLLFLPVIDQQDNVNFRVTENPGLVNTGSSLIGMTGTVTEINIALQSLNYSISSDRLRDSIEVVVMDVSRRNGLDLVDLPLANLPILPGDAADTNYYVQRATMEIAFNNTIRTEDFRLEVAILWSSIIAGSLLCIGCIYGVSSACIRRAIRGERAAAWFVKNILFTHVESAEDVDDDDEIENEARRASAIAMVRIHIEAKTMARVRCCAHLFSCLCPCCYKFDAKAKLPTEEDMLRATTFDIEEDLARKHVPKAGDRKTLVLDSKEALHWTVHEHVDEKTGAVRRYIFNPHTGKAYWKWEIHEKDDGSSDGDSGSSSR